MSIDTEIALASPEELRCYLAGASRDGTHSRLHKTLRISQKGSEWLDVLGLGLSRLDSRSWKYQEGDRGVWTLETSWWDPKQPVTDGEMAAFSRGYFDAEGGVPRNPNDRFYLQFVQKDLADLSGLRDDLIALGIQCGRLHNPSVRVDPNYWRFYVRTSSHRNFCAWVGSWHPRKRGILSLVESRLNPQKSETVSVTPHR